MSIQKQHSRLGKIKQGPMDVATRFLFYGAEGIGKSTLAANAPAPIFFDLEDGTAEMDVARYTFRDDARGHIPQTYEEILAGIHDLLHAPHDFKTLVIDTIDRLEGLIWNWMIQRDSGKKSGFNKGGTKLIGMADYPFNSGYTLAIDEWRRLSELLDLLRLERNIHILILGHASVTLYKNPEGEDYDRYNLALHKLAAGFWKGWPDVLGYCCFEGGSGKLDDGDDRARGYFTGRRLIRFCHNATFDAKSRIALPKEIVLDLDNPWAPLAEALEVGHKTPAEELIKLIKAELDRLEDLELSKKVQVAVKNAKKDREKLGRYLNELQGRNPKEKENQDA